MLRTTAIVAALLPIAFGIPAIPRYFTQRVDHFSVDHGATFQQRYYENTTAFGGPGSPIIVILGGEGEITPETGIFYPSIVELAGSLRAAIYEPEHRGYGTSQPSPPFNSQRLALLTAPQALADAADFITAMRRDNKCSGIGGEPRCPVLTVGGSYPGWLSAMMR